MDTFEKKYNEFLERAREAYQKIKPENTAVKKMLEEAFPELRESESGDERMYNKIIDYLLGRIDVMPSNINERNTLVAWLEKQKEPEQTDLPAGFYYIDLDGNKYYSKEFRYGDMKVKVGEQKPEELAYRLNGLMQEYIKEGEDEDEKEHRLKCYKLFWDALEDTSYFEQKEQKPVECSDCAKHLEGYISGRADAEKKLLDEYGILIMPEGELRMKPSWKPSEEQMKALNYAIAEWDGGKKLEGLYSLRNDLKKL